MRLLILDGRLIALSSFESQPATGTKPTTLGRCLPTFKRQLRPDGKHFTKLRIPNLGARPSSLLLLRQIISHHTTGPIGLVRYLLYHLAAGSSGTILCGLNTPESEWLEWLSW